MPKATQETLRLQTRSMTSSAVRRSARLGGSRSEREYTQTPLPFQDTNPDMRRRAKKRRTPSRAVQASGSRYKKCEQTEIGIPTERRLRHVGTRESMISGGSSVRSVRNAACSRTSSRVKELEDQLDMALQDKQALVTKVKEHKDNIAQLTLKHLEEYFTCPLCFDIMACPYSLVPRNCGHTFCATCILKWFFSRLHKGCGGWHEAVDCPLCRSALPLTPERTPRSASCFPFTPNRTVDVAIRGFINSISHELANASTLASDPLSDWNEGGHNKREWHKRARAGNNDMTAIAAQWSTLKSIDFVNIKNRLQFSGTFRKFAEPSYPVGGTILTRFEQFVATYFLSTPSF